MANNAAASNVGVAGGADVPSWYDDCQAILSDLLHATAAAVGRAVAGVSNALILCSKQVVLMETEQGPGTQPIKEMRRTYTHVLKMNEMNKQIKMPPQPTISSKLVVLELSSFYFLFFSW